MNREKLKQEPLNEETIEKIMSEICQEINEEKEKRLPELDYWRKRLNKLRGYEE